MDVHSVETSQKVFRRLFIAIGHGVLVPEVSKERAGDAIAKGHDSYLAFAAPPFPLPNKPGVVITTAARGKPSILTQVNEPVGCSPQVVNVPHEMLTYVQTHNIHTLGGVEQMMRDMRSPHNRYKYFESGSIFATRLPSSVMESTVLWARGSRIVYGGMWMIDMDSPTELIDVSEKFGMVKRMHDELNPSSDDDETLTDKRLVDAAIHDLRRKRQLLREEDECANECEIDRNMREDYDLSLSDCVCNGELRYPESDEPISLQSFLEKSQHLFREDDALVLISCRTFAKYASHLEGGPSSPTTKFNKSFGGKNAKAKHTKKKHIKNKKASKKKARKMSKMN
jgi:hypothetical protein